MHKIYYTRTPTGICMDVCPVYPARIGSIGCTECPFFYKRNTEDRWVMCRRKLTNTERMKVRQKELNEN